MLNGAGDVPARAITDSEHHLERVQRQRRGHAVDRPPAEHHDKWDGADRRYYSEHSMALRFTEPDQEAIPELTASSQNS